MSELASRPGWPAAEVAETNQRSSALARLLIVAIVAGQFQSILAFQLPGVAAVNLVDDAFVALALLAAAPRLVRASGAPAALILLWIAILAIAVQTAILGSGFPAGDIIFMFRQVAMPAFIVLIGLVLTWSEWERICKVVVAFGLLNVVYIAVELVAGRPFDPVQRAAASGDYIGYYNGSNVLTGSVIERAGGMMLNPPSMGMFLAVALVIAVYRDELAHRSAIIIALGAGLWLTNSRGGLLLAVVALLLPWVARRFNAWVTGALLVILAIPVGIEVSQHRGSYKHSAGLLQGLVDGATNPLGRGFGFVGNHRPAQVVGGQGESLLGIAFSAGGWLTLVLIAVAVITLVATTNRPASWTWLSALAIGGLLAGLFAESAGAIDATVPIWLGMGIALRLMAGVDQSSAHPPGITRV